MQDHKLTETNGHSSRRSRKFSEESTKPFENYDIVGKKLSELSRLNLTELPDLPQSKTSLNRTRLFVFNFPQSMKAEEFEKLFERYGKNSAYVCTKKAYCLVSMDTYENATKALQLNGHKIDDKILKVRFSQPATVKVENLCPYVSNELLYAAFGVFGEIESCHVNVNEKGKSLETGVIEFKTKSTALNAVKRCSENCFFVSATLRPAVVELYQITDKNDTLSESSLWKDADYYASRTLPPRFAKPGSLEYAYARQWLELHSRYKEKQVTLEREFKFEVEKLQVKIKTLESEEEIEKLKMLLNEREKHVAESKMRCQRLENMDPQEYFGRNFGNRSLTEDRERFVASAEEEDRRRSWQHEDRRNFECGDDNEPKRARYLYGYDSC